MKKIFTFVLAMVMVATLFAGCGARRERDSTDDFEKDAKVRVKTGDVTLEAEFADLVPIPGYDYLYYSETEKSVFYLFSESAYNGYSFGYFGPYIRNGHYCEYRNGEIVEVIPTVRIEDVTD